MLIRVLKKPPIREAIISVSFKNSVNADDLAKFCDNPSIKEKFPIKKSLFSTEFAINNEGATSSQRHDGFILSCEDGCNRVIQSKIGQLSFHNTNSYIGWDLFYKEFRSIWQTYCQEVGKMDLTQLSVRYINQLTFALPLLNGFEEYLKFLPTVPEGINRNVNGFFLQLNVPSDSNDLTGIITETFALKDQKSMIVTLDLNVIKSQDFICNSDEMWSSFKDIREFKNTLFFSCLTEKTINMYE